MIRKRILKPKAVNDYCLGGDYKKKSVRDLMIIISFCILLFEFLLFLIKQNEINQTNPQLKRESKESS